MAASMEQSLLCAGAEVKGQRWHTSRVDDSPTNEWSARSGN